MLITSYGYDNNTFLLNTLIHFYGVCGQLASAQAVFNGIPQPNQHSWNILLNVYVRCGHAPLALGVFDRVSNPDACTLSTMIHAYGERRNLEAAETIFRSIRHPNLVCWTAMITAYTQNGDCLKALELFYQMQLKCTQLDRISFVSAIDACSSMAACKEGMTIHNAVIECSFEQDPDIGGTLVNMYGKCGNLPDARAVFTRMHYRTLVSWNTMITVSAENGHGDEAIALFYQMQYEGVNPNHISFIVALNACNDLGLLQLAQSTHAVLREHGENYDSIVADAMIYMYSKRGAVNDALKAFQMTSGKNVDSFTAMIGAYAYNGYGYEALHLFWQMQSEDIMPTGTIFASVLLACNFTGLVEESRKMFVSMPLVYGIIPMCDHYMCMIDLLGRAGHLDEVEELIISMPSEKLYMAWFCMLCACRLHGDVERGLNAAAQCFNLVPKDTSAYTMLSNMHFQWTVANKKSLEMP